MIGVASPPGDKFADSAHASSKVESAQTQETAPTEVVTDYSPSKDPDPVPSHALVDPTPISPRAVSEMNPTPEPAASASAEPNTEPKGLNALDAKKASETPAPTEAPPAIQGKDIKPDGPTELPSRIIQYSPGPDDDLEAEWGW